MVTVGGTHTCAVSTDNRAYCWGHNFSGELGDGTTTTRLSPVAVAGSIRFVQISAGYRHTCGVTTADRVYCWGENSEGQIGDGTQYTNRLVPVMVAGGRRYRQVRAGSYHSCALTTADLAFCWGNNEMGQLGSKGAHITPTRVLGGHHFRRIIAGGLHTCGATKDDKAYCWGNNDYGELGDGHRINRIKPLVVVGNLPFREVLAGGGGFGDQQRQSADAGHSCGVTRDGVAYCWGYNTFHQVNGSSGDQLTPQPIGGQLRFVDVNPGDYHTCGLATTGKAYCWGYNNTGAVGDGTTTTRPSPVPVAGGLTFRGISTGPFASHSCGVTTDRRVYCWGANGSGQLGDGTTSANRLVPVAVLAPM
jgi:alpha-tubulin suppressor-like RCC1 family protein